MPAGRQTSIISGSRRSDADQTTPSAAITGTPTRQVVRAKGNGPASACVLRCSSTTVPLRIRGKIGKFEELKISPWVPLVAAARSLTTEPPNRRSPSMTHGSQHTSSPIATAPSTSRLRRRVTTSASANSGAITSTLSVGRTRATKPAAAAVRARRHHTGLWTARGKAHDGYRTQPHVEVGQDQRPEDSREPDGGEEQRRGRRNSRTEHPKPGPEGNNQTCT
jgi:hypothetical protein